jgi:hypothetical protein
VQHVARRAQVLGLSAVATPALCSAAGQASGEYLQATSQFPGKGPCYPVWAATTSFFHRCAAAVQAATGQPLLPQTLPAAFGCPITRPVPTPAPIPTPNSCFPRIPDELMSNALNALNASAGLAAGAAGALADDYGSVSSQLSVYIADISKGMLIVVAAGLGGGVVLSLVRRLAGSPVGGSGLPECGCTRA